MFIGLSEIFSKPIWLKIFSLELFKKKLQKMRRSVYWSSYLTFIWNLFYLRNVKFSIIIILCLHVNSVGKIKLAPTLSVAHEIYIVFVSGNVAKLTENICELWTEFPTFFQQTQTDPQYDLGFSPSHSWMLSGELGVRC